MATDAELSAEDYNVAWICALPDVELDPARLMLDDEHKTPFIDRNFDNTTYIFGRVEEHRVVVACLPEGETGNVSVSRLTYPLFRSFPNIKIALLVGIGGGVPRPGRGGNALDEIYLGDVVIGFPGDGEDAVVYYDRGKVTVDGGYERKGRVQDPDWHIKQALGILRSNHRLKKTKFNDHLMRLSGFPEFEMPGRDQDYLFKPEYHHKKKEQSCESCDTEQLVQRPKRTDAHRNTFVFHQGRIATGNSVIKSGERRDKISEDCGGALCIEMEAAGVSVNGSCLVIRGISDYADSHKNDKWKLHAAKNAAVFARELLRTMQASRVKRIREHVRSEQTTVLVQEPEPETKLPSTIASDPNNTPEADSGPIYRTDGKVREPKFEMVNTADVSILSDLRENLDERWLSEPNSPWYYRVRAPDTNEYSYQLYAVSIQLAKRAVEDSLPLISWCAHPYSSTTLRIMCREMAEQLSGFLHRQISQPERDSWEMDLLANCLEQLQRPVFGLIYGFESVESEDEESTQAFFQVLQKHASRYKGTKILFVAFDQDERLMTHLPGEWWQSSALEEIPIGGLHFKDGKA